MRYATACSGIEAPSVAWRDFGWQLTFVAEIEPYCCHLLHQKYGASRPRFMPRPEDAKTEKERAERRQNIKLVSSLPVESAVPNLGDMTQADPCAWRGKVDLFVCGAPCQSFSVAGLRRGLHDDRGNITLRFVEFIDAIEPTYTIFENVPGILSDKTNAFGCLLAGVVGADTALLPPDGLRWTNAGVVDGPNRSAAWRVLDAQYFGVPQRRERVFLIASSRDAAHPAEIIFEREGVQRYFAPRREAGEGVAGTFAARTRGGGGLGTDFECAGGGYRL